MLSCRARVWPARAWPPLLLPAHVQARGFRGPSKWLTNERNSVRPGPQVAYPAIGLEAMAAHTERQSGLKPFLLQQAGLEGSRLLALACRAHAPAAQAGAAQSRQYCRTARDGAHGRSKNAAHAIGPPPPTNAAEGRGPCKLHAS